MGLEDKLIDAGVKVAEDTLKNVLNKKSANNTTSESNANNENINNKESGVTVEKSISVAKKAFTFGRFLTFLVHNLPIFGIVIAVIAAIILFMFNPFGWELNFSFGNGPKIDKTLNLLLILSKWLCVAYIPRAF